uniref:VWFC domain-containing protein n=1 Tax=Knipowitschia caucasica TaxID=637954 RepID=A0AAV2MQ29_KNICA
MGVPIIWGGLGYGVVVCPTIIIIIHKESDASVRSKPARPSTRRKHGEQWQKDPCVTCVCDRGQSRCHSHTCPRLNCQKGQSAVRRPGLCCEECVWPKGSCLYEGLPGPSASGSGCEFCSCSRGQVLCQRADCQQVHCPQGSDLVIEEGKCCPVCSSEKPFCVHHGKTYKALSRWSEDSCRECECRAGHVTCYVRSCPTCTPGLLSVTVEGQCCPQCQQVRCNSDCSSCSGRPDNCESCSDPSAVLHLGRCLPHCPPAFYQDKHQCKACAPSCLSCSGPSQCDSCGPQGALLSPDGAQCVSVCPSGSFQLDHTHCRECHSSCSECVGPSETECVSCVHLSSLLKHGQCVSDCGPGYYSQDSNCYACDSSCESCFPDKPLCSSCPPGTALHYGKCISECPPQHFKDSHNRCRGCHNSCRSCWGPSVSQCSDCPSGLFLHQGQCVDTCGEGMYPQEQACLNCHPSCRYCVGPLASDCVMCLKPEQVLVPQYSSSQHGVCAPKCPKYSYTDPQRVCRDCDSSCLQCTGPSPDSCISCPSLSSLLRGRCVPQCPEGSYSNDGLCIDCNPSCRSCSGSSQADCTSCGSGASLTNGFCRSSCGEGHYYNPTTSTCTKCSADCQRCTADLRAAGGSVCLWCKEPRAVLLGGRCVLECPVGYFGRHGSCVGQCAPSCPQGFYQDAQRNCLDCDPQCLSCSIPGACTACQDPNKVLQFGECQYETCAHQYYINTTTRTCRECDWSCNSCRGPLKSDCVQCMEGHVLQDGLCFQHCSRGHYREGDHCQACDPDCEQCLGPNQCQLCASPLLVFRGLCVEQCGPLHYPDPDTQVCKACSSDCVMCDGLGQCRACAEGSFLLQGYCTPDCGPGFYSDANSRTCQVNVHPPRLRVNGSVLVPLDASVPLSSSLLRISDEDSAPRLLLFELHTAPSNGHLYLRKGAKETELKPGYRFSPEQLRAGQVVFTYQQDKSRSGEFVLRATDSQLFSEPKKIQVLAISTQLPSKE